MCFKDVKGLKHIYVNYCIAYSHILQWNAFGSSDDNADLKFVIWNLHLQTFRCKNLGNFINASARTMVTTRASHFHITEFE